MLVLHHAGVAHRVHEYAHDPRSEVGFGMEAAAALGVDARRVFKTLVVRVDGKLVCAVVPASGQLDPKALASACGGKRAELADPHEAELATGYVVGGISPLGQKRTSPTVLDESAQDHETILVSGGRRGLSIEIAPADLAQVTGATVADVVARTRHGRGR